MKGICTNWDCPNFDENKKKIIEIPDGEEFVCPKCGKRLVEYTKGESWFKKHKIAVIAASVVVVAIVIILCLTLPKKAGEEPKGGNNIEQPKSIVSTSSETPSENTIVNEDPAQTGENNDTNQQEENSIDTIKVKPRDTIRIIEEPPVIITNVIVYSFGKYVGDLKYNAELGKEIPDGRGKMYYNRKTQIAKHDIGKHHIVEKGDCFDGSWCNGDIVEGKVLNSNNEEKYVIRAGARQWPYDLSKEKE